MSADETIRRVIIAGSRTIELTPEQLGKALQMISHPDALPSPADPANWTHVISGRARGVDMSGEAWAEATNREVIQFPVTDEMYAKHGRYLAPKMRNREMAEAADAAVLFWDASSGGTADMCIRMVCRRKPVWVIPWKATQRAGRKASR